MKISLLLYLENLHEYHAEVTICHISPIYICSHLISKILLENYTVYRFVFGP